MTEPIQIEFEVTCSPEHGLGAPRRLAYLWHLGTDRTRATEVDISFTGEAETPPPSPSCTAAGTASTPTPGASATSEAGRASSPHYRKAVGS